MNIEAYIAPIVFFLIFYVFKFVRGSANRNSVKFSDIGNAIYLQES
jgi:hypothetical protein